MNKIMRIIYVIAFIATGSVLQAQRFAYIDSEYILKQMPEYNSAQKQLDLLAFEWQKEIEQKKAEIDKLKTDYEAEKIFLLDDVRNQRLSDIAKKERELTAYQVQRFGVDGDLFKKRRELIQPIQDRIFDAIQKVAKDNALDFLFDKAGGVTMLYTNPKYDRSEDVLEELGVVPGAGNSPGGGAYEDDLPNEQPK